MVRGGSKHLIARSSNLSTGEFLRDWRLTGEMSLKEFGRRVDLSPANLCDVEKGRKGVSPQKAEAIALAIGVPPALLVRLSLEDELKAAGLKYKIAIEPDD